MKSVSRILLRVSGAALAVCGLAAVASGGFILAVASNDGLLFQTDGGVLIGTLLIACGAAALVSPIAGRLLLKHHRNLRSAVDDLKQERDTLLQRIVKLEKNLEHVSVIGEIHIAGNIADRHERLHALLTAIAQVTGAGRVGLYLVTPVPQRKAILRGYYEQLGNSQVYLYVEGDNDWWQAGDLAIIEPTEETVSSKTITAATLSRDGENLARIEVETLAHQMRPRSPAEKLLSFLRRIRPDDGGLDVIFESPRPIVDTVASRGRHLILYPLWAEGQMIGALRLEISPEVVPQERVCDVTAALDAAAVHVALAVRKEQYRYRAETDALTGLLLKRSMFDRLAELCKPEGRRQPAPFSLIMIDIDHFKKVNDAHGHLTGDVILRSVASVIRRALRGGDTAFRYGGEEMAVILPGLGADEAKAVAERLRGLIEEAEFRSADGARRIPITVSLGVAEFEQDKSPDELIARADAALYSSKKNGRNRTTVHNTKSSVRTTRAAITARHKAS